jgi:hypothetical protein
MEDRRGYGIGWACIYLNGHERRILRPDPYIILQPEPIKNLNELVKAQLHYFSSAAETLSASQGEIEELSVAAEGEYR